MTPAERAVEAGAEAVSAQRQDEERAMGLRPIAAVLPLDQRAARAAIRAALLTLAADPATTGLCASDLAAEMEVARG